MGATTSSVTLESPDNLKASSTTPQKMSEVWLPAEEAPPVAIPASAAFKISFHGPFTDETKKTTCVPLPMSPALDLSDVTKKDTCAPPVMPTRLKPISSGCDAPTAKEEKVSAKSRMKANLVIKTKEDSKTKIRKRIEKTTEDDVNNRYIIGDEVMPSTNTGMDVLHAKRTADGEDVVIKRRARHNSFKSVSEERDWRNTTEYQLNMPNVETLCIFYEALETHEAYYVVMEKVMGKDLFEVMASERVSIQDAREIVRQILQALSHMHGVGRIHKDLKIENVMVAFTARSVSQSPSSNTSTQQEKSPRSPKTPISPVSTKLIDFDTVQDWEPSSPKAKDVLGTDGYIAPEAYGGNYSPASDIYAVGVIMYKLLTRKYPFRNTMFDDKPGENWVGSPAMKRIQSRLKAASASIDFSRKPLDDNPMAVSLCAAMLSYNPDERPSAEQALAMPWFSQ